MIDLSAYAQTLEHKKVAVFGLGLSGLATIEALLNAKISVTAWDDNADNKNKAQALGADIEDLTTIDLTNFDFLLLAPGVPYTYEPHDVVANAQKHNLEIIGDLELLHRSAHGIKIVGITGTNGKSTATALLTHTLNECGVKAVMGGNIGKAVMALDMSDLDVLVLEISSYQMDLCPSFRPDIAMILNISADHLDRHGSMKAYVDAKKKIVEDEGVAVIDIDDDFTMSIFDSVFCAGTRKIKPVSVKGEIPEGLFVKDNILKRNKGGKNNVIGALNVMPMLKGLHNQQNMACCYAVAKEFELDDQDILRGFTSYAGLPHRQYQVASCDTVTYINDSKATNAEAAAKALAAFDTIYWIIGGRAKASEGKTGLEGLEIFNNKVVKTYVIGEAQDSFAPWLVYHHFNFEKCGDLETATRNAHRDALQSDKECVVLLSPACASWDQFASFEARGDLFSKTVLELLDKDA